MSAQFTATLPDGLLVVAELDAGGWWAVTVTRAGEHVGYRRHRPLAAALAGAGAPPDVHLTRAVPGGQLDLFASA